MSNYTKATNFGAKDALPVGDANKKVKGLEIDNEFNAIANAVSTKADTNSPTFTGTPSAPTATAGTETTQIATTAFVTAATDALDTAKADLASPDFTGTPTAPTAAAGTDTTQIASTAMVQAALAQAGVIDTTQLADDAVTTAKIADDVALGGNPTTTTQAVSDRSTRIATTDFVRDAIDQYAEVELTSAAAQASASSDSITVTYGPTGKALILASAGRQAGFANQGSVSYTLKRGSTTVRSESGNVMELESRTSDSTFVFFYTQTGKTAGSTETWTVASSGAGSATYATIAYIGF